MESAIGVGLDTIKVINTIIMDLRSTPDLVQRISAQSCQLERILGALHRQHQTNVLSDEDTADWLGYQTSCNMTLSRIEDVLANYARGTRAKVPILSALKFLCGPKGELSKLIAALENCVEKFLSFSEVVHPQATMTQPSRPHDPEAGRMAKPVVSLNQYVQMAGELDDGSL